MSTIVIFYENHTKIYPHTCSRSGLSSSQSDSKIIFFFFFGCTAQHVEHSLPGIECTWRLNHWSGREVPKSVFLI